MLDFDSLCQKQLSPDFFYQPTIKIAKNLLGMYLVSTKNNHLQVGEIIETEAYLGIKDQASHARFGQTNRNSIMWGPPGRIYVYLVYGIHHLMNIITQKKGIPAAVLLRSLKPIQGIDIKTDGPGKICKALNIIRTDTGTDITNSTQIFIANLNHKPTKIIKTPRVGINYAQEPWLSKKWRFIVAQN